MRADLDKIDQVREAKLFENFNVLQPNSRIVVQMVWLLICVKLRIFLRRVGLMNSVTSMIFYK